MESFNNLCLKWWEGFYSSFQNSCTMTCISEDGALDVKHGEMSILLGVGGSETSRMLDSCGIPDVDVIKFNNVLCQIETLCMPKIILMYEQYKSSLHLESKNGELIFDSFQIMDEGSSQNDLSSPSAECQSDSRVGHIRIISAGDEYCVKTEAAEDLLTSDVKASSSITDLSLSQEDSKPQSDAMHLQDGVEKQKQSDQDTHCQKNKNHSDIFVSELDKSSEKLWELGESKSDSSPSGTSANDILSSISQTSTPKTEEPKSKRLTVPEKMNQGDSPKAGQQNIHSSSEKIRRSSRQVRVSSRFAEDSEAIRKLIKPNVTGDIESFSRRESTCICSICKAVFSEAALLRMHWKSHKGGKLKEKNRPFLCGRCLCSFPTLLKVKKHRCSKADKINTDSDFEKENIELETSRGSTGVDSKVGIADCAVAKEENDMDCNTSKDVSSDIFRSLDDKLHACDVCSLRFLTNESLIAHQKTHGRKRFKCNECGQQFCHKKAFVQHSSRLHDKNNPLQCQQCSRTFLVSHSLEKHVQTHQGKKVYCCELCGKNFRRQGSLLSHQKLHERENEFQCQVCQKGFSEQRSLDSHASVHTGEKPHVCEICGKRFRIERGLLNHGRLHDKSVHLKCDQCPKTFIEKRSLQAHMLAHSGVKPFTCGVCGKAFRRELGLVNHSRLHDQSKAIKCDVCHKSFVDKWGMLKHKTIHTGEKPFTCDVCGKSFRIKKGLLDHVKLHDKNLQYKCELCPRTFVEKRKLETHIRAHRGEKAYVCEQCGQRFINSMTLKVHKRRHTGEKPYKCSFCDKAFNQQGTLIAHERYHKGEKPYVCEVCGEGFVTKSHLTIHRRKHFNDRPYKCEQCDYAAFTFSLLRIHMLKHSTDKPYKCHLCSSAFKRPHHLDVHMRTHLGTEKLFSCQYCSESFDSNKKLTNHLASHEIVVVLPQNSSDETLNTEGLGEVAYDIVLLS